MINVTGAVLALVAARQAGDTTGATRIALAGALLPNPLTGLVVARVLADQDARTSGVTPVGGGTTGTGTGIGTGAGAGTGTGTGTGAPPPVRLVQVPRVRGTADTASDQVRLVGLVPSVAHVAAARPVGAVIGTEPDAGVAVPIGSTVTIEISDGIVAPDLVGQPTDSATAQLEALGLVADVAEESRAGATGVVLDQFPDPGLPVGDDRRVVLIVRAGGGGGGSSKSPTSTRGSSSS